MPGMFDDLIAEAQGQGVPQPAAQPVAPQEESWMDSAGRGMGNALTFGTAPYIGGAIDAATGGSFDQGYNRSVEASERSEAQNPDAYTGGKLAGAALPVATGAGVIPGVARSLLGMGVRAILPRSISRALDLIPAGRRGIEALDGEILPPNAIREIAQTLTARERQALSPEQYVRRYGPDSNAARNARELQRRLEIDELAKRRDTINLTDGDPPPSPPWAQ